MVNTPVTPNHLTSLRLLTGIGAACAFAVGTDESRLIGAAVMTLSLLLDRADGELARQSGKMSQAGHRYDLIADGLSNGVVFMGIGIGLADSALGLWALALGLVTGGAAIAGELLLMRMDTLGLQNTAQLGGWWGFDPDDGMFLVPVAVALGVALELLIVASVGAVIAALVFLILLWRRSGSGVAAGDR
ncbi:MAG: CDP-alcohol phosphatidyltransferase family protein [Proteobacteria bacterium]|nr:CDP-alcohol phosphatidyltransferase family protein [Pseudomonadota bacterium]MDA1324442.1 CDP-alcohol phosphatidyltransferase family protein [Pseudomonadota bacterium]